MSDAERDALLVTLAGLHDEAVRRATLVTTPHVAYEPLPAGLADRPARILTMLQHHTLTVIGFHLLGLPQGAGSPSLDALPAGDASVEEDRPFQEVVDEFRATVDDLVKTVAAVDLNALLAHPYPGGEGSSARRHAGCC